jgi:hypothetical protein
MSLKHLLEMGPWDWPQDTGERVAAVLRDGRAGAGERLAAVKMAGDHTLINDELAGLLLGIVAGEAEPDDLRAAAAIALGPGLETASWCDDMGVGEPHFADDDTMPFTMETWRRIQQTLLGVLRDERAPKEVRRRALEAAVRSPEDWHREALLAAWESEDEEWRLTAVFGMEYVDGFDEQIVEALECGHPEIRYRAVRAAGNWEVGAAWTEIVEILDGGEDDSELLMAAIRASATINPSEAPVFIEEYLRSEDDEIVETAQEAMGMARGLLDIEDEEEWDDEDDDEDGSEEDEPVH